jgi:hypothetical protein
VLFGIAQEELRGRMFPNVRLMIVAVMASVVALIGGFGVFAAFRVNHEPLARLSNVTAQSQLVADSAAPRAVKLAAGEAFGPRFQVSEALIASVAPGLPAPKPDRQDSAGPPSPVATAAPEGPTPPPQQIAVVAPALPIEPNAKPDGATDAANEPPPAAQAAVAEPAPEQAKPEIAAALTQAPPVEPSSPETKQETKPEATPSAGQAPPVEQASQESEPAVAGATEAASADNVGRKPTRKTAGRQRVAAKAQHRARRPRAIAIATANSAFPQSGFQTGQPAQPQLAVQTAPQAAVKRRRVAKRPTVKQSAVGGPFVSPPAR